MVSRCLLILYGWSVPGISGELWRLSSWAAAHWLVYRRTENEATHEAGSMMLMMLIHAMIALVNYSVIQSLS